MTQDDDRLPDDWEPEQHRVFHEVFALSVANQVGFVHPEAIPISDEHWRTLCHNFAFWSATSANGDDLTVTDDNGAILMTSETGTPQ